MTLIHWPECTNNPCTCGQSGDLLFSSQPLSHLVTPVQRQEPIEDIDSTTIIWCLGCRVRPVDPDYAPFCGIQCSIDAENED